MTYTTAATDTTKFGIACKVDSDCSAPQIICDQLVCSHKNLFPMNGSEVGALIAVLIMLMVCSIVGVSGGVVLVPLAGLLMGFNAKQAVALSNTITVFQTGVKYVVGLFKKNPQIESRTLVDYNLALILTVPLTLLSVFGSMVAILLPDVFTMLLFSGLFLLACAYGLHSLLSKWREARKASNAGAQANEAREQPAQIQMKSTPGSNDPEARAINEQAREVTAVAMESTTEPGQQATQSQIEEQKRHEGSNFYPKKFLPILAVVVLSILVSVFRPGKNPVSTIGISKCSAGDWLVLFGYAALMLGLVAYTFRLVLREQVHKQAIGWKFDSLEVQHTKKMLVIETICCSAAGFIITIIGIGAGIPLNPMLSMMGVSPLTAAHTINLATLVSKIAAVVVHIMYGDLLYDYVFFYGGFVVVGVIISENLALFVIKKFKSLLMFPIIYLFVCCVTLALGLAVGVSKWRSDADKGLDVWTFQRSC